MPLGPGQLPLITPLDLQENSTNGDFIAQFVPRPLLVQITTGGVLGSMLWTWKRQTDDNYGPIFASEDGVSFSELLGDPGFGTLTFLPGTYNANDVYKVSTQGVVTGGTGGGVGLLTATRFDPRVIACAEATSVGITYLQPRCVPPIVSIGPQITRWFCDLAMDALRSRQGMTPVGAGAGDDDVRRRAKDAKTELQRIGASEDRPPDIIDSSAGEGKGFNAYPVSDDPVGW